MRISKFTAYLKSSITAYLGCQPITAYLDVKVIMHIKQIELTLYITLIRAKPHIRFPKFTYVDEKFLGEF